MFAAFKMLLTGGAEKVPPTVVAASTARATTASVTCNFPAGVQVGDLLIAVVTSTAAQSSMTATGWTLWQSRTSSLWGFVLYRTHTSGTSAVFTGSGASTKQVTMVAVRNGQIDTISAFTSVAGNAFANAPSITSEGGITFAYGAVAQVSTLTAPAGMTSVSTVTTNPTAGLFSAPMDSAGATGPKQIGMAGTDGIAKHAIAFCVKALP